MARSGRIEPQQGADLDSQVFGEHRRVFCGLDPEAQVDDRLVLQELVLHIRVQTGQEVIRMAPRLVI